MLDTYVYTWAIGSRTRLEHYRICSYRLSFTASRISTQFFIFFFFFFFFLIKILKGGAGVRAFIEAGKSIEDTFQVVARWQGHASDVLYASQRKKKKKTPKKKLFFFFWKMKGRLAGPRLLFFLQTTKTKKKKPLKLIFFFFFFFFWGGPPPFSRQKSA